MDKYSKASKAVARMRKKGIQAYTTDKGVFLEYPKPTEPTRHWTIQVSEAEVENWAYLYDDDIQKVKDADPYETLEEIARIFHYRGWDIGDGSTMDTDFIDSSDEFLGLVYQAFNPIHKK